MSNSTSNKGIKGLFAGDCKGLRLKLQPYRNQLMKGIRELAAQVPQPKAESK